MRSDGAECLQHSTQTLGVVALRQQLHRSVATQPAAARIRRAPQSTAAALSVGVLHKSVMWPIFAAAFENAWDVSVTHKSSTRRLEDCAVASAAAETRAQARWQKSLRSPAAEICGDSWLSAPGNARARFQLPVLQRTAPRTAPRTAHYA